MEQKTRELPVQLSEEELKIKGEELAKMIESHTATETEKKRVVKDYSDRLKESSEQIRKTARIVQTGKEDREVLIKHEYLPSKNLCRIYREDTGDLVESRSMTAKEYQLEFFDDEEDVILEEKETKFDE